jgi:hypothetical protein
MILMLQSLVLSGELLKILILAVGTRTRNPRFWCVIAPDLRLFAGLLCAIGRVVTEEHVDQFKECRLRFKEIGLLRTSVMAAMPLPP